MPHVFISYLHDNAGQVQRLCNDLTNNGIEVWLDRNNISPGQRWRYAIRQAIQSGDFFLACFSVEYGNRGRSYMNEELTLAIDMLRQRPRDRTWFIPVVLSGQVPDWDIGVGETLRDLQYVDLSEDWDEGVGKIVGVIRPIPSIYKIGDPLERTKLIIHDLQRLSGFADDSPDRIVRFQGFLSAFAINEKEKFLPNEQDYKCALLKEKENLVQLARHGYSIRCIITPPTTSQDFFGVSRVGYVIPRVIGLLNFLNAKDSALKNIKWSISPRPKENLYIIDHLSCFEGSKKDNRPQRGYDSTNRHTEPSYISTLISTYDGKFDEDFGEKTQKEVTDLLQESLVFLCNHIDDLTILQYEDIEEGCVEVISALRQIGTPEALKAVEEWEKRSQTSQIGKPGTPTPTS